MDKYELPRIFADRLYEMCLLKDVFQTELVEKLSQNFDANWLESCFSGREFPNDLLLVALSRYFDTSIDVFFEKGGRINEKALLVPQMRKRKIETMEKIFGKKLPYSEETYRKILEDSVREALDRELMTISKAAAVLDTSVYDVRRKRI